MDFDTYRQSCINAIQQRPDYISSDAITQEAIVRANAPFEYIPAQTTQHAALMIHGLFDSPCVMSSLADCLQKENIWVSSLLLPGHGTQPEDLLTITFEAWLTACRDAIARLPSTIEHITLVGFSTGALLSHYLMLNQELPRVKALIMLAPALALPPLPTYLLKHQTFTRLLARFLPWYYHSPLYDYAKYTRHPLNAAYQVQRLINHCEQFSIEAYKQLPVYMITSSNDCVTNSQVAWRTFQQACQHPQSRCLIYSPTDLNLGSDPRLSVRDSRRAEPHIENMSHIALPIAPNHPHYGIHGDYTHNLYAQLPKGTPLILGERGGKTTARLTYNPDFAYMSDTIIEFLKGIYRL